MGAVIEPLLPTVFAVAGVLYLWLAVRIPRGADRSRSRNISYFLFLIALLVGGTALSWGADEPRLYAIGRVMSLSSGCFLPVVLYLVYRNYTVGPPSRWLVAALCAVPIATTVLAVSNPVHGYLWTAVATADGERYTSITDHAWFTGVYLPFVYGVFGYSMLALAGRLVSIARAHRKQVALLLIAAGLPYAVSIGNVVLDLGPSDFPVTASTFVLLLPLYWWATLSLKVHEFSPIAYQTLFDRLRDPIIVLDPDGRIIGANRAAQKLLRKREADLVGRPLGDELPQAHGALDALDVTRTVQMTADRFYELGATRLTGPAGQNQGTVVVCRDVTERNAALRALADSEHLIRSLIENSSNGILRFARDAADPERRFRCVFANRAAERFLGNEQGALVGMPLGKVELLEPERLQDAFGGEGRPDAVSYEIHVDLAAGECWLRVIGEPVGGDFSVTLIDVTQRKRTENKMLADALRDPLTGVLNRRGFEKEAAALLSTCDEAAVLYLDLNQFKSINDRFGHQAGDALLKAFGHRLGFCLRPGDILARMGGDEFAIVLPEVSVEEAKHIADRLVETASEAYIIQGQEIKCAASVGIALMPTHGRQLWALIGAADRAMYQAKGSENGDDGTAWTGAAIAS